MDAELKWVLLGIVAILSIISMVLMFGMGATGQVVHYQSPEEACGLFTKMCDDGLPPVPTGNIDYNADLVECKCQTNPYKVGWRSMKVTPWKR